VVSARERRIQKATMTYATGWSRGFELAGVTAVFVLVGLGLDKLLGTRPICTVVLGVLAMIGLGVRSYYSYRAQMDAEEEGKPWTRTRK
jgi:uncharacterized membrane protein (UPF0136 family)